jgi:hypothetical protein
VMKVDQSIVGKDKPVSVHNSLKWKVKLFRSWLSLTDD